MNSEIRQCQNCKGTFTIKPEDFLFYERIHVPPPTWCPSCRYQRRLMVRNERNLYRRECGLCRKSVVAMYSADPPAGRAGKPFPVYCQECWWGDGWDPMAQGAVYNFEKPFFGQFRELQERVPRPSLATVNCVRSEYANYIANAKDSYLCFGSIEIENCLYGSPYHSKYCVDTYLARECEYCYECIDCEKLSSSSFCQDCSASLNLLYCFDCKNCQDCIGCAGLRGKSYCILNQPLSKADYLKEKERIMAGGRAALEELRGEFEEMKQRTPHRFSTALQCANVSGDHIVQSKNVRHCFDVKKAEECAYCVRMIDAKDVHDVNYCEFAELCYDYLGFWKVARAKFSNTCGESSDIEYSELCSGSSNLFGCAGLRKKQYCILNRQYSRDEYEKLRGRIVAHMNEMPYVANSKGQMANGEKQVTYRYGEFFPPELSLFAYNESVAQDFFPRTREEVLARGYAWKEPEVRNYAVTLQPTDIPARIEDVADSITERVVGCAHAAPPAGGCTHQCTTAFKIIPAELQFYRKLGIPLPRLCPNCRHYARLTIRNPARLWHRRCMCQNQQKAPARTTDAVPRQNDFVGLESGVNSKGQIEYKNTTTHFHGTEPCPNEFETPYSPERPEIVYCEACYQQEIV